MNRAQIIEMAVWSYGLKATEQEIAFAMAAADHALEEAAKRIKELEQAMESQKDEWLSWNAKREDLERNAERWNWWMSDAPKDIQTYLFGCREKWTAEQWNAWADAAIRAAMKGKP